MLDGMDGVADRFPLFPILLFARRVAQLVQYLSVSTLIGRSYFKFDHLSIYTFSCLLPLSSFDLTSTCLDFDLT